MKSTKNFDAAKKANAHPPIRPRIEKINARIQAKFPEKTTSPRNCPNLL
jgi:hypothetical protein